MQNPRHQIAALLIILLAAPGMAYTGARRNFLSHGPSVAALGCGETGTANRFDLASAFYNPALLAGFRQGTVALSRFALSEDSAYNYAGIGYPLPGNTVAALSAVNLASGNTELRQNIDDTGETVRTQQWAYLLTLARKIPHLYDVNAGLTLKYVYEDMHAASAGGMGLDLGVQRTRPFVRIRDNQTTLSWGAAVQNALPPAVKLKSSTERFSSIYRAGAALNVPVMYRYRSHDAVTVLGDMTVEDRLAHFGLGAEYAFAQQFFLRAGLYDNRVTAGAGISFAGMQLNYAADFSEYMTAHRLGLNCLLRTPGSDTARNTLMTEARRTLREDRKEKAARNATLKPLFRSAVRDFDKGYYLYAIDKFGNIMLTYPESESAAVYYDRILQKLRETAGTDNEPDLERLSYAQAFFSYQRHAFGDAVNEWEKVIELNPQQEEVRAYLRKTKDYLADQERREREKEAEAKAQELFLKGSADFENGTYVSCIRTMEKLQTFCTANVFASSLEYHTRAKDYINRAIGELSAALRKNREKRPVQRRAEPQEPAVIDEEGAARKYKEGLIMYAQGKLFEAEKYWEIALRLNPGHEKARRALEKVKQDAK